jgi:N-methylhydantoinase B
MPDAAVKHRADPVVTEIVRNGVIAVTGEMKTNLTRTAYNTIIYEALDFTTGLFTPDGRTVSIGIGLPTFIRGMAETIKAKIAHFGIENIHPGDILVTNDSYTTGSHLNHVTLSLPIFEKNELVGWACTMAHWLDVGGVLGGITTDIFSEGLQIPILKLYKAGKPNQDLIDVIRMNCRIPERAMGDLRAELTAVKTGERRFLELVRRYGKDEVLNSIEDIMDRSERVAREHTVSIPDGTYEAESFMDDDGLDLGKRVPIKVKVVVKGEQLAIDLSGVSNQVRGFFNAGKTTSYGCSQVAYKCLTSPTDYPINDGSFRSLEVICPPGKIVSAVRPAPMRWWMTYPMTIIDTVFKAMAPAIPDRVIAGHHADLCVNMMNGIHPQHKTLYIGGLGPQGGGWGAKRSEDGVSATVCMNDGDTHNSPVEMIETKYPVRFEAHSLIPDSGGPGRRRGGLGVEYRVRTRADMNMSTQIERKHCKPWGLEGGLEGAGNDVIVLRGEAGVDNLPNAKALYTRLANGDGFIMRSGGGGGFGDPRKRPVDEVVEDVRQGYVSVESARSYYGVIIDPKTFEADIEATKKLRAS